MENLSAFLSEVIKPSEIATPTEPYFDVTKYGVIGDGVTNNTKAINALIKSVSAGIIFFPPGRYLTGTIMLKSNMTLYLSSGAEILGSQDFEDYPEQTDLKEFGYTRPGRYALIAAAFAENVTVTGGGTVNGRGDYFWDMVKNKTGLPPELLKVSDMVRPRCIQPVLCRNVKIKDITVKNSACWTVHPLCCDNVIIDGISIKNPVDSPNTDGINPESCSNVRISNCIVDVGDDCITLKAGTENDPLQKRFPCENITVTNCNLLNGHGGVVIGSEMSGCVRNITVSNCIFSGTDRGIRIKTRRKRGGSVSSLMFSNLFMTEVYCPFTINGFYRCGASCDDMELFDFGPRPLADDTPVIEDISVNNLIVRRATVAAMYIIGIPERPVKNLRVHNFSVESVVDPAIRREAVMLPTFEKMQGKGIIIKNVSDSVFSEISVTTENEPLEYENLENVTWSGKILL